jgi:hypothetical protein
MWLQDPYIKNIRDRYILYWNIKEVKIKLYFISKSINNEASKL